MIYQQLNDFGVVNNVICRWTNYPAFYRGRERYKEPEAKRLMKLRAIWAEGSFAMLKREHKLKWIQKRGLSSAKEECLLACMAVNLKRMVRAIHSILQYIVLAARMRIDGPANLKTRCYEIFSLISSTLSTGPRFFAHLILAWQLAVSQPSD